MAEQCNGQVKNVFVHFIAEEFRRQMLMPSPQCMMCARFDSEQKSGDLRAFVVVDKKEICTNRLTQQQAA